MDDFSNKKPCKYRVFFFLHVICHTLKKSPPPLAVDVEFLVHLRLPVAEGPEKHNSNCLQEVLLPFGFSVSDSQV